MRYSLRTLIVVMLLGGPLVAWGWQRWEAHRQAQRRREAIQLWLATEGTLPPPGKLRDGFQLDVF